MIYDWRKVDLLTSDLLWFNPPQLPLPDFIRTGYVLGISVTVCHRLWAAHCGCECMYSGAQTFFKLHDPGTGEWPVHAMVAQEYARKLLAANQDYVQLERHTMTSHTGIPSVRFCAIQTNQTAHHDVRFLNEMDDARFAQ